MSEIIDKTIQLVDEFVKRPIVDDLNSKGITTTGQAAESLRIESDEYSVRLIGVDYMEFLNKGRGPGRFPPPDPIVQWVIDKFKTPNQETKQVAYAISLKISQDGTKIFQDNSEGIELEKKVEVLNEELRKIIPQVLKAEAIQQLNEYAKRRLQNA